MARTAELDSAVRATSSKRKREMAVLISEEILEYQNTFLDSRDLV